MATIPAFRTVLKDGDFARGLEGLSSRAKVPSELQPSGVAELDGLLGGGVPRGSLVELCGPASSGRTSLSLTLLARATGQQQACAFVDVSDSLDPLSLAAAGVDCTRLLWIRCGGNADNGLAQGAASAPHAAFEPENSAKHQELRRAESHARPSGFIWQHPRNQMRGIEAAIPSLVGDNEAGKAEPLSRGVRQGVRQGMRQEELFSHAAKQIHVVARCAGEQVEADRQGSRREESVRYRDFARSQSQSIYPPRGEWTGRPSQGKPWKRLEQALKTTDLLLHSGGWGVVVFDVGNLSWVDARRIPLSTWFRFQRIVENTPTILLLLGEEPCAKSCASLVLRCRRKSENWNAAIGSNETLGVATLQGFEVEGEVLRSRTQHGSSHSIRWKTRTPSSGSSEKF
jgi:recombination protein RecA